MALPNPVIIVPGVTATDLLDEYELPPDTVWSSILAKNYKRITLHPNDLRYEAQEPARVIPSHIFEIAYKEMISELRHNLQRKYDQPVPVYPFGYDWRKPLQVIESELAAFIDEVIGRTKLLKHYHSDGYAQIAKVNLIGHSMGGLIITGYLQSRGKNAPVDKVATLATPYQGSFEAVIKIITGTADLGVSPPTSREREAARVTPALYHLIPSFSIPNIPHGMTFFDPRIWQSSVIETIGEFIHINGLPPNNTIKDAEQVFSSLLLDAKNHRNRIDSFKLDDAGLTPDRWLAIIGVGSKTRVKINVKLDKGGANFILSPNDRQNNWGNKKKANWRMTGDGTVPFDGAIPKFLKENNLILVTPDDYGYWEVQDRLTTKIAGFHGILPNMDMLHRLIARFLTDGADNHNNTWGRSAPGITKANWKPPLKLKWKG